MSKLMISISSKSIEETFIDALNKVFKIKKVSRPGTVAAIKGLSFDLAKLKKVMRETKFVPQSADMFPDGNDYFIEKGEVMGVFSVDPKDKSFDFEFSGY